MSSTAIVPIVLCERRAQKVHDSIHIGMTVQEVLDTGKDCDAFQPGSEFPYDQKADGDNIPAMGLSWRRDGTYRTYDLAARRDISFGMLTPALIAQTSGTGALTGRVTDVSGGVVANAT